MSITTLKTKFARIVDDLTKNREKYALNYAGDLIALVNDRLINEGIDANGKKFPLYSDTNLGTLTPFITSKSNAPKKGSKVKSGSYTQIRKALGLPIDKRTHSFNGEMLKSIDAKVEESNKYLTIIEIKSKDAFNQKKLLYNSNRMKINLLLASKKEKAIIDQANKERLRNLLK
jgi:hypothetical protein